jgi:SAM-dependent methyltransferase
MGTRARLGCSEAARFAHDIRLSERKRFDRIGEFIEGLWSHPVAGSLQLDAAETVAVHCRIIKQNPLLAAYYRFVYEFFRRTEEQLKPLQLRSVEIGSGGGFLKEFIPDVITSDVVAAEGIDRVEDATRLSFPDRSIKAVYANGVLHHIPEPQKCLSEIQRVLVPGGMFVCNEPSSTPFGYFMNRHFHKEYTDKTVTEWTIPDGGRGGRLTGANMAIPYVIFKRDRAHFDARFPCLRIRRIVYHDFMRYTLSGGLSYKPFVPSPLFETVNILERLLKPLMPIVGHAMIVTVEKLQEPGR